MPAKNHIVDDILMVGAGESYHLEPLAQCIKAAESLLRLGSHGLWKFNSSNEKIFLTSSPHFDYLVDAQLGLSGHRSSDSKPLAHKQTAAQARVNIGRSCINEVRHAARTLININKFAFHCRSLDSSSALIHLQSLFIGPAHYWLLGKTMRPFVVSCWGSDVLRNSDMRIATLQQEILNRSSAVTCTSPEFKEILLAKFGRHLEPKIVYTYFNPGVEAVLESCTQVPRTNGSGTKSDRINVCLGHNGFHQGNHLQMLAAVKDLEPGIKNRIKLRIPMTYGTDAGYMEQVETVAERSGCDFEILSSFMTNEETAAFRNSIDVLVFAPISDAFSATVSQAFAAGTVVVLGEWLPNRLRRLDGFHFAEIRNIRELTLRLTQIIQNWTIERELARQNVHLARKVFSEESIGRGWIEAYKLALQVTS